MSTSAESSVAPSSTVEGSSGGSVSTGSSDSGSNGGAGSASGLSGGAIAGIVVGTVVLITIASVIFWFLRSRRKRQHAQLVNESEKITHPDKPELPQGRHHEKTELPAQPNHVSELTGDRKHTIQRDEGKEVVNRGNETSSNVPHQPAQQPATQVASSRILSPHELAWDEYRPNDGAYNLASGPRELSEGRSQETSELATTQRSVKRKPVELQQGMSTVSSGQSQQTLRSESPLVPNQISPFALGSAHRHTTTPRPARRSSA